MQVSVTHLTWPCPKCMTITTQLWSQFEIRFSANLQFIVIIIHRNHKKGLLFFVYFYFIQLWSAFDLNHHHHRHRRHHHHHHCHCHCHWHLHIIICSVIVIIIIVITTIINSTGTVVNTVCTVSFVISEICQNQLLINYYARLNVAHMRLCITTCSNLESSHAAFYKVSCIFFMFTVNREYCSSAQISWK